MPKYKLRLVDPGQWIFCEGDPVYAGETAAEALAFYADEYEWLEVEWVHPEILRGRVVYALDTENGDCHEDAEPGDTTYDLVTSDPVNALRPLRPGEVRTWPIGSWRPGWCQKPPWASSGIGYEVEMAGKVIGNAYRSQEAARCARDSAEFELVEAWKLAHPEFYQPLPEEADDA